MEPRFENIRERKLIGKKITMSFSNNKTRQLWQSFMPYRRQINSINNFLYSLEIYEHLYFDNFNPDKEFEKWAAMEVAEFENVPSGMITMTLPSGLYAVFIHKGPADRGHETYNYIFRTWLPDSGFELDDRPHFALMGEKYRNDDPSSEEEIWIPVRPLQRD